MLRPRQVVPRGVELHRLGHARGRRRSPAEQRLDSVQVVPAGDARGQRAALVGPAIQRHLLAAHARSELAASGRQVVHVLVAVAVAEQDRHQAARVPDQLVVRELADLGGGAALRVADVHGARVAVEVDPLGEHHDQFRAALGDRLLDPQVDDRDVLLGVGRDHDNDARVIYLFDVHQVGRRSRDRRAAVLLHLRALQRAVEQAAEQVRLLVGDVLGQRDAEARALALDALGQRAQRGAPRGPLPAHGRRDQAVGAVHVRVVEAAPVADPALVDVVVLARRDAHQLAAPLPQRDVAADRAFRAHAGRVRHVPRPRLEAPHARGEGADGAEVDDVAAEYRLQRLVELACDVRVHSALADGQLLLPRDLVVVARAAIAEHAALTIERDVL